MHHSCAVCCISAIFAAACANAATFGKVVAVRGSVSDIALDERHGRLYIANLTANRIEVMNTADFSLGTPLPVSEPPTSLAVSPDNHFLIAGETANFANSPAKGQFTIFDLDANTKLDVTWSDPVLAVAFGSGSRALAVTSTQTRAADRDQSQCGQRVFSGTFGDISLSDRSGGRRRFRGRKHDYHHGVGGREPDERIRCEWKLGRFGSVGWLRHTRLYAGRTSDRDPWIRHRALRRDGRHRDAGAADVVPDHGAARGQRRSDRSDVSHRMGAGPPGSLSGVDGAISGGNRRSGDRNTRLGPREQPHLCSDPRPWRHGGDARGGSG